MEDNHSLDSSYTIIQNCFKIVGWQTMTSWSTNKKLSYFFKFIMFAFYHQKRRPHTPSNPYNKFANSKTTLQNTVHKLWHILCALYFRATAYTSTIGRRYHCKLTWDQFKAGLYISFFAGVVRSIRVIWNWPYVFSCISCTLLMQCWIKLHVL